MVAPSLCKKGLHPRGPEKDCVECKRAYHKAYYLQNAAKIKERSRKWSEDNVERAKARGKTYYRANSDRLKDKARKHRDENLERAREYDRAREATPERKAKKKRYSRAAYLAKTDAFKARARASAEKRGAESERERLRLWRQQNPERARNNRLAWYHRNLSHVRDLARKQAAKDRNKGRLNLQRRRARLRDGCSPGVTRAEWAQICEQFADAKGKVRCAYCNRRCRPTIDHVIPICRGGRDEPSNIKPACRSCNCSKGGKLLSEWTGPWKRKASQSLSATTQTRARVGSPETISVSGVT